MRKEKLEYERLMKDREWRIVLAMLDEMIKNAEKAVDFFPDNIKDINYTLYIAENEDLTQIGMIYFIDSSRYFGFDDGELAKVAKDAYKNASHNKVTTALIAVAKHYVVKNGIKKVSVEEQILEELKVIAKKYNVSLDDLHKILEEFEG